MKRLCVLVCIVAAACACMAEEAKGWLEQSFGTELVDAQGKKHQVSELKGKIVGIYFSAHWCPPCRQFTPKLVEFRDACAKDGFEIVFVSFDKDKEAMSGYMNEMKMKWLAVPYKSQAAKKLTNETYNVHSIPTLIVLDKNGKVITKEARKEVEMNGKKAFDAWRKK